MDFLPASAIISLTSWSLFVYTSYNKSKQLLILSGYLLPVDFSPKLVITCLNSAADMYPLPSRSKTRKASLSSSSLSASFILLAIITRNSPNQLTKRKKIIIKTTNFKFNLKKIKHTKVYGPGAVLVHFVDHVLDFGFGWVLPKSS